MHRGTKETRIAVPGTNWIRVTISKNDCAVEYVLTTPFDFENETALYRNPALYQLARLLLEK